MAGLAFAPHAAATGGDAVFYMAIVWLSVISMVILACVDDGRAKRRRSGGPVFVGGRGCACGGCRDGAGVCGTYLS